ncbi:hypothetical protein LSAT2_018355 [Lamellibrachia satsuma]|nr:hypothetical protein LSAT2_018355 [Lamellibrachia satsuma]
MSSGRRSYTAAEAAHTHATSLKMWKLRLIHDMADSYETTCVARRMSAVDNLVVDHVVCDTIMPGHPLSSQQTIGKSPGCWVQLQVSRPRLMFGGDIYNTRNLQ